MAGHVTCRPLGPRGEEFQEAAGHGRKLLRVQNFPGFLKQAPTILAWNKVQRFLGT